MTRRHTLSRLTIASLAAAAVAAPSALAQPADVNPSTVQKPAQQADMHASTVHKPAPVNQDLRSEGARQAPSKPVTGDLRTDGARPASRTAPLPSDVPGPPTWPMHPQPITGKYAPVATSNGGDGGGIDIPASVLIIAGSLALAGGMGVAGLRARTRTRTAH